jgi:hypothetical protein
MALRFRKTKIVISFRFEMSEIQDTERSYTDDWLWQAAAVQEQPFTSPLPLIGRFIAALRSAWSQIADRPYVRPMRRQQNELNRLAVQQMAEIDAWLLVQDREKVAKMRETALLASRFRQLGRRLEAAKNSSGEPE